jgi:hypothetical protein
LAGDDRGVYGAYPPADPFFRVDMQHHQRLMDAAKRFAGGERDWDSLKYRMGRNELPDQRHRGTVEGNPMTAAFTPPAARLNC